MRFQTIPAFQKHLGQSSHPGSSLLFTVLAQDPLERKFLRDKVLETIGRVSANYEVVQLDLAEASLQILRQELDSSDLFASKKVFILKNLDKASKVVLEGLSEYLLQGNPVCVIFEGQEGKSDTKLYEKLKKEMVVIDLTKEKPWERKSRLLSWVESSVQKNKKSIHKEVLELLYEKCQKELSLMIQEVDKLLCYAKDASKITLSDLNALCGLEAEVNTWSLCEGIIWDETDTVLIKALKIEIDQQEFYSFLGQLRYQCQVGLKIKTLLSLKVSQQEFQEAFLQNQHKNLEKYLYAVEHYNSTYFTEALTLLFDYEMKAKSSRTDPGALWVSLLLHLKQLQKKS